MQPFYYWQIPDVKPYMSYFNRAVFDANWRVPTADNTLVVNAGELIGFLLTIKNCEFYRFNYLNDLYAIDLMGSEFRFAVVYRVSNYTTNVSLMLIVFTREGETIDTIQDVYTSSTWPERESWEMLGVYFAGHRQLQRLLTDYSFKGHPLRKDFPVVGYRESWYSYHSKTIESSKVEFMQEMRIFDFIVAWKEKIDEKVVPDAERLEGADTDYTETTSTSDFTSRNTQTDSDEASVGSSSKLSDESSLSDEYESTGSWDTSESGDEFGFSSDDFSSETYSSDESDTSGDDSSIEARVLIEALTEDKVIQPEDKDLIITSAKKKRKKKQDVESSSERPVESSEESENSYSSSEVSSSSQESTSLSYAEGENTSAPETSAEASDDHSGVSRRKRRDAESTGDSLFSSDLESGINVETDYVVDTSTDSSAASTDSSCDGTNGDETVSEGSGAEEDVHPDLWPPRRDRDIRPEASTKFLLCVAIFISFFFVSAAKTALEKFMDDFLIDSSKGAPQKPLLSFPIAVRHVPLFAEIVHVKYRRSMLYKDKVFFAMFPTYKPTQSSELYHYSKLDVGIRPVLYDIPVFHYPAFICTVARVCDVYNYGSRRAMLAVILTMFDLDKNEGNFSNCPSMEQEILETGFSREVLLKKWALWWKDEKIMWPIDLNRRLDACRDFYNLSESQVAPYREMGLSELFYKEYGHSSLAYSDKSIRVLCPMCDVQHFPDIMGHFSPGEVFENFTMNFNKSRLSMRVNYKYEKTGGYEIDKPVEEIYGTKMLEGFSEYDSDIIRQHIALLVPSARKFLKPATARRPRGGKVVTAPVDPVEGASGILP